MNEDKKEQFNKQKYFFERMDNLITKNKTFTRRIADRYARLKHPILFKILRPLFAITSAISFFILSYFFIREGLNPGVSGVFLAFTISAFNLVILDGKKKESKNKQKLLKALRWNVSAMTKSLKKYKEVDTTGFEDGAISIIGDFIISYATGYINSMKLIFMRI